MFTPGNVDRELEESTVIWSRFHNVDPTPEAVIEDLNEPPNGAIRQDGAAQVLDWGTWAAHQQRHLVHALMAVAEHTGNLGDNREDLISAYEDRFAGLALYPIALRSFGRTGPDHNRALAAARVLVEQSPGLLTQATWTLFLQQLDSAERSAPFPLETRWFTPGGSDRHRLRARRAVAQAWQSPAADPRPGCPVGHRPAIQTTGRSGPGNGSRSTAGRN